jgi:hypothetical protein
MSGTMIPDLVVGEVGFGSNFAPEADFYRAQAGQLGLQIADLEAEVAELIRHRNRLRRVLQKCAALSPEISDEKHAVLLETDPKNLHREQEND